MVRSFDNKTVTSSELAQVIGQTDFTHQSATIIGFGMMGHHFVKALQALEVDRIRVCSRSAGPLAELDGVAGITILPGGYINITEPLWPDELAIVATPTADMVGAVSHLVACGYRRILIEKPVSFSSGPIQRLSELFENQGVDGACAYNRVAYPSFIEAKARTEQEGGITSCAYSFTEFVDRIGPDQFSSEELSRWGIANSLHVISMAHGLIGAPSSWHSYKTGAIDWHPAGAVFVGSGISDVDIPFSFHADWGSTGRWSVEAHTSMRSYRLCPLEKLFCRNAALGDWEEIPVTAFAPEVKEGITEQVAAMFDPDIRRLVPLISIEQAAYMAEYAEEIFGYD